MKFPKNANLWLPSYLRGRWRRRSLGPAKRVWVALTDHYEPMGGKVSLAVGEARVAAWQRRWPEIAAAAPRDASGQGPCFTAFYPQEEYEPVLLDSLASLTRLGNMDVEVHLHHFNDNAVSFAAKVREFTRRLRDDHGLLHEHHGQPVFGFIHGNWALDNSHPTGHGCGVVGELQVLRDLGCYADFTMPSMPSQTQSRIVNQIYWTTGDPARPRGFDEGMEATVGGGRQRRFAYDYRPGGGAVAWTADAASRNGRAGGVRSANAVPGEAVARPGSADRRRHLRQAVRT